MVMKYAYSFSIDTTLMSALALVLDIIIKVIILLNPLLS